MIESFFFLFNHIFLAYTLMYFVIPRYLLQQRYWATASATLLAFLVSSCLSTFLGLAIITPIREMVYPAEFLNPKRSTALNIQFSLLAGLRGGITTAGIAAAIKLMKYWYMKEQKNLQLQKENIEAQLQLLKGQVHPHFLFNTLNNIYAHTQGLAPVANRMIIRLSNLLRYMIYEGNRAQVPLSSELKLLRDYIGLEKMRYGTEFELHLDLPEETNHLQVAPLLLLPLVENCFKHGTSNMLEKPWINLEIRLDGNHFLMKLMNGKADQDAQPRHPGGIGITNVKKRLNLLYPGKHELTWQDEGEVFIVTLEMELNASSTSKTMEEKVNAYA